jgi:hypothetical protein
MTSFNAEIDLSLPTNKGITILGKTTMSLNGNKGKEILTSILTNMDIILNNAIAFYELLRILCR